MKVYEGRGRLQSYWRRLRSFHYRVPPPKESITEFRESPLENEHTGSARICHSPCVIRRRSIVTLDGNGTKRKAAFKTYPPGTAPSGGASTFSKAANASCSRLKIMFASMTSFRR